MSRAVRKGGIPIEYDVLYDDGDVQAPLRKLPEKWKSAIIVSSSV